MQTQLKPRIFAADSGPNNTYPADCWKIPTAAITLIGIEKNRLEKIDCCTKTF